MDDTAARIEALRRELHDAIIARDKRHQADVRAELDKLAGPPPKETR